MAPRPKWWHQLQASKHEVLLAVDLYNRASQERSLEGFIVHMQIAWLYLLHAHFMKTDVDYWYRDAKTGRRTRGPEGDFRSWELRRCLREAVPSETDAVRKNVEFFIGLRDKVEHRYERHLDPLVAGKCQALIANYETKITELFGEREGVASALRFPVFLSTLTGDGVQALKSTHARLPRRITTYIRDFDDGLPSEVREAQAYDFRVLLIPQTGPKSTADVAMRFVRLDDLDEAQLKELEKVQTIIRDKEVPVQNAAGHKPSDVARRVTTRLGVHFSTYSDHAKTWRHYKVRPATGVARPERTRAEFCLWDRPHGDYVYTDAWIEFLVKELADPDRFREVLGHDPVSASPSEEKSP